MATFITPAAKTVGSSSSWLDVDCSANIPSGATGVILRLRETGGFGNNVGLRKNGSTDTFLFNLPASSQAYVCVGVDGSRIFEVNFEDHTIQTLDVCGYFTSEAVFFTNAVAKTPTTGSWQTVSIASDTGGDTAVGAFIIAAELYNFGMRHGDSTDTRTFNGGGGQGIVGGIVGCNASEEFDVYSADSGTLWVTGYMTTGVTFNTNGTDRSLGSTATYTDLTALPSGAIGGIYYVYSPFGETWALRENGSADDRYMGLSGPALIEADGSRLVEGEISATTVDFWEQGYFTSLGATLSAATPSGTLTTRTRATLGCTTDTASGTLYAVIDTAANISGITAAQVVAGNRNDSAPAVASTSAAISSTTPSTGLFGSLSKGTLYSYALAQVTGGNSNVVTGTFTTSNVSDTYFTDFREYTAGSPPGDWTIADSGTGTLNVATDVTGPGGKVLQITTQSGVRYSRATWNDTSSDGDSDRVEVVALLRAPSGVAQYGLGMGVQVCRQAGVPYAGYAAMYGRDGYDPAGTGDIGLIRAGNSGQIASIATSTFAYPTAGEKVWLRLQKTGTTVNAWFWDDGAATKTNVDTPDLTNTDANYGSGDIGIYLDMVTSGFSVEVLAYGVGFNGVAPPMATYGAAVFGYQRMLRLNN